MSRWTDETWEIALSLMENGFDNYEISQKVKMSESSVSLLRYSKFKKNCERIKCAICGEEFKQIRNNHLINHNINLKEYRKAYPDAPLCTESRKKIYKNFKNKNNGKTYEEIYGVKESIIKKEKISKNQIGRKCAKLAGTGITGTRRDTNTFARSTYEANVDRIFIYENKSYFSEFDEKNKRFELYDDENNENLSYQPDRFDVDGLFCKGAYIEVKGYMFPKDWRKICLFRKNYDVSGKAHDFSRGMGANDY